MTDERPDVEAIRARCDAASPGPWHGPHVGELGCVRIGDYGWVAGSPEGRYPEYDIDSEQGRADAEFIAHARADVPALVAEIERFRTPSLITVDRRDLDRVLEHAGIADCQPPESNGRCREAIARLRAALTDEDGG